MGFQDIIIGVILSALFLMALVSFGTQLAIDNNAVNNIIDDPSISGINNTLNSYLGDLQQTAETQRNVSGQQEAQGEAQDEGFGLTAIVGAVTTFFSSGISSFNLIFKVISDVLGIPAIVLNVIFGAIIIVLLILIWRLIKVGGR